MKKNAVRNYLLGAVVSFFVVMALVVAFSNDSETHETKKNEWSTVTTITPVSVPAFEETAETQKVLNPCETISIEHIFSVIPKPTKRGPVINNVIAPSKLCEWMIEGQEYPRLGVSIVLSSTVYDASEVTKLADVTLGEKAFIVDGYVTGVGGAACGRTIIVKEKGYSYSVAVCNVKNKKPSNEQLIELATDVSNSLP